MLGDHPITPVLLATDLAATREFYHDRLGLEILTENDDAIVFKCGGGTHLDVTKSTVGTADEQTQVSWQVPDLRAEVAELRSRGVKVEDYDLPGLKTEDGIADLGFAWMAWIMPPGSSHLGTWSRDRAGRARPGPYAAAGDRSDRHPGLSDRVRLHPASA